MKTENITRMPARRQTADASATANRGCQRNGKPQKACAAKTKPPPDRQTHELTLNIPSFRPIAAASDT